MRRAVREGSQAVKRGLDMAVIDAFIIVPPVGAVLWLLLLSGGFNEGAAVVLWVLFAFALRPLIWLWAADRPTIDRERCEAYKERMRNSVNTAFLATVFIGLAALDVIPLPGGRYWTHQPRASFALVAVVIYVVWLSRSASIPDEVRAGYARLFGRKEGH